MQISLENRQTQVLSPQMMQSMTILRMSSHELSEYINSMSMENPVMEVTEGAAASTPRFSDSLHFYGTSSTANSLQWQPDTKDADSLYAQLLHQLAISTCQSKPSVATGFLLRTSIQGATWTTVWKTLASVVLYPCSIWKMHCLSCSPWSRQGLAHAVLRNACCCS